jgi:hypothetical protein
MGNNTAPNTHARNYSHDELLPLLFGKGFECDKSLKGKQHIQYSGQPAIGPAKTWPHTILLSLEFSGLANAEPPLDYMDPLLIDSTVGACNVPDNIWDTSALSPVVIEKASSNSFPT